MKELYISKIEFVSGGNGKQGFVDGVNKALDQADRGALIGGTLEAGAGPWQGCTGRGSRCSLWVRCRLNNFS